MAFTWNEKKERAAVLLAEDAISDEAICREIGVKSRKTLALWKLDPEFDARFQAITAELGRRALNEGIARRENRVRELNDRWRRMKEVIRQRADDPTLQDVPGGRTGLIVRQVKAVKVWEAEAADTDPADCTPTKQSRIVEEFAVDTGLLNELRQHEKQAAQELGQWDKKDDGADPPDDAPLDPDGNQVPV